MATKLKHFPDKPWEQDPKALASLDRSGNYSCTQKIDGWRVVVIFTPSGIEYISRHNKSLTQEIEPEIKHEVENLRLFFGGGSQIDAEWLSRRSCSKDYKLPPKLFLLDLMRLGDRWLLHSQHRIRLGLLNEFRFQELKHIALPLSAAPGEFSSFYEAQKVIPHSEGVVLKHLDSKIVGDRNESQKNPLWIKIKYRSLSDGEQKLDHLRIRK